ncbi:tetrapyrrole methylase family protein / MazG family protein [Marinitoga hydrogenitolerans DSM 16785]|uniref:Tetrapyrrole methylase family protein / MazG family protein n=1 Tax=Marinitoga hydrogenitolerans (strain DSM 16785 / JCM 12826 / AT1271) TaxID=1122195 RepID=A0A1M4WKD2_MARH1|nr:MazG family protein [Marinitoga hydrogenitolerans]SHE81654.1 tetrapyrrole methylase family protein / MazG family protein [Marinitoga hydrogenitolerans DSM 16785]
MKELDNFNKLLEIMETLRSEKGCPWDKKQTHESLKPYAIEEAYELVHAIDGKDKNHFIEELGDVLLQVIFHSQIAKENGDFTINDVLENLNNKLIRRHPHVFENEGEYSYEQWEKLKAKEKGKKDFSKIGEYNNGMPPLMNLRRLIENAFAVGYDPYKDNDIINLLFEDLKNLKKDNLNEKYNIDFLTHLIYFYVKNNINIDSIISKAAQVFIQNYKKYEDREDFK